MYVNIYDSQIVHHNACFNLFILHKNSFDNQRSEINKNDIFYFSTYCLLQKFYYIHIYTHLYIYTYTYMCVCVYIYRRSFGPVWLVAEGQETFGKIWKDFATKEIKET